MLRWLAAALVVVAAAALAARTLPEIYPGAVDLDQFGLNYTITYANGLALVAATAILLCFHLTTSDREPVIVRALAAAVVPLLVSVLVLTRSVGVALACAAAVAVVSFRPRHRQLIRGALATVPSAAVAAIVTLDAELLRTSDATSAEAISQGRTVAIVTGACALNAGVVRLLVDRLHGIRPSPTWARRATLGLLTLALLAFSLAQGSAQSGAPEDAAGEAQGPAESLESRIEYWDAALEGFADSPLTGSGAGSFREMWAEFGDAPGSIRDAHSLYLETPAELGIVGTLVLAAALGLIGIALVRLLLRSRRSEDGALVAVGALWLVVAAFEWVWELPAVSLPFFAVAGLALAATAPTGGGLALGSSRR